MTLIYESEHFTVEAVDHPHIDRADGGHIKITPKKRVSDVQHFTPQQATELMRLVIIAGEAMSTVMNKHGVDIGRINYQDNGNWSVLKPEGPYQHVHLYGRAKSAKTQKYGEALSFPYMEKYPEFYASFEPLTLEDTAAISEEMGRLFLLEKHSDAAWKLT